MTPVEIAAAARRAYNASSSDPFSSDTQMYEWLYQASMILAKEGFLIEKDFTTTTVVSPITQEYAYPTNAFAIKKLTYDGKPVRLITFKEDDILTGNDQSATTVGPPVGFVDYGQIMYLRPIPDEAKTLRIWTYNHPAGVPTASTVLDLPDEWHISTTDFLLMNLSAKNKNYTGAQYYQGIWEQTVEKARRFKARKKRGGAFGVTQVPGYTAAFPLYGSI